MNPPYYFCKDNLLNYVTSYIFSKTEIYDFLLELQAQHEVDIENAIEKNLEIFKYSSIEDFNIPQKFRLTVYNMDIKPFEENKQPKKLFTIYSHSDSYENLDYFHCKTTNNTPLNFEKSFFRKISICSSDFRNNRILLTNDETFKKLSENIVRRSCCKTKKIKRTENDEKLPYFSAIKNLRKIESIKSPILKMKNIIKTSILIIEEIKNFYEKNKMCFDYQIESDDILSIFIYICSKANVKKLYSQCKLIERFLSCKVANSISGYYLITLMASLSFFSDKKMGNF